MPAETTLKVPAIHCGSCIETVTRALQALPSVEVSQADPETKLVRVRFEQSAVTLNEIREALDEIGFTPDDEQ